MKVTIHTSAFRRTRWYEYLPRFLFGGAVTALAGIVAQKYGPVVGGLFLAFPAIFPAGATLIESHEKRKKRVMGGHGTRQGRRAAGVDAAGASMGAIGLLTFAVLVWKLVERWPPWSALLTATAGWMVVSVAIWRVRQG